MKKSLYLFMVIALAGFAFVAQPRCAWACSCIAPGTPQEELERSAAVFVGTVNAIGGANNAGQVEVTFDVAGVWKGDVPASVVVKTTSDSASCGFNFEQGEEYIVYAYTDEETGNLAVSLCSRTQLTANAAEDIEALGEDQAQTPEASPSPSPIAAQLPDSGLSTPALAAAGGLAVVAAIVAGVVLRRRSA